METKVLLTPKQAAEITGMSLRDCIIIGLQTTCGYDEKEIKKLAQVTFELNEFIVFPAKQSPIVPDGACLVREAIKQINSSFQNVLIRILSDKTAIEKIELTGANARFIPLLTPEQRRLIYSKLAERHIQKYSNSTKAYNNYLNISRVCVPQ
jgi:hypothetical protein